MKTFVRRSVFFALIGLILSPLALAYASSSPADSVHFCQLIDYEQWRRDHPRPAGKRLANLDVGPPRTVRLIYFLPNDRPFRQEVVDLMKVRIREVQTFYADQMQAHGYGNITFRFETDAQGEPLVHRVDGQYSDRHYLGGFGNDMREEIEQRFHLERNIYLIVLDNSTNLIGNVGGAGGRTGKNGGFALVPGNAHFVTVAHELGHAFGLEHDWRDDAYIMSYGPRPNRLSACAAEFLTMHPHFNFEIPLEEGSPPTIELISPRTYPAGSKSVPIQLKVVDSQGLHQVILYSIGGRGSRTSVKACRGLSGERDAVVEFEYDGVIPSVFGSSYSSSLSDLVTHLFSAQVVDLEGNEVWTDLSLVEASPYLIAILEGHTREHWVWVNSLSFSPDGALLASGAADGTVILWDVATQERIATLQGYGLSVSFSPDGTTLASAGWSGTIILWDVRTQERITTLEGPPYLVRSLSFSPDGALLAYGNSEGTIILWEVATRERIATLQGHRSEIHSVSFSPDGTLLASGSDYTVKLWEVATRERIATLQGHRSVVASVSFSSDGTLLASAPVLQDGMVELWEVATRERIATLQGHTDGARSVSFSASDGALLATGGWDGKVILWDVLKKEKIVAFGHTGEVHSVSVSLDGTTLAAGGGDGTILLWDISKWMRPYSFALESISGDGQEGPASTQLARPFVVSVLDQNGSAFAGSVVTFFGYRWWRDALNYHGHHRCQRSS